ncbi:MAG: GDSL-type esterase/lipase family protein [Clostridia bacterium]|jgi:lysophospholipase L1-like esterase|nr:GDSL-type esterase/lipase family protein [Clostridia bacterium]
MSQKTFVALGASITAGYPYKHKDSWVEQVGRATGWRTINAGVPGDTFADLYERLEDDVFYHYPHIVSVMAGTNDCFQGFSQSEMQQNFLRILEKLTAQKIQVIVGLPLPVDTPQEAQLKVLRSWLRAYAAENGFVIIDFAQDFFNEKGEIQEELLLDGCHPTREGYALMGERAISSLRAQGLFA